MEGARERAERAAVGGLVSRASVLGLVGEYAFDLDDAAIVDDFYDDAMWDATRWGVATQVSLVTTTRATATYELGPGRIYGLFYDDVMLSSMTLQGMEAVNRDWRLAIGQPRAYITQDEDVNTVRLYKQPDENAKDFIFLFGSPLGHDFPNRALGVVMSERRDNLPAWLDVPLALGILGREYARESNHRDAAFAAACRDLGQDLLGWVLG